MHDILTCNIFLYSHCCDSLPVFPLGSEVEIYVVEIPLPCCGSLAFAVSVCPLHKSHRPTSGPEVGEISQYFLWLFNVQ